MGYFPIQCTSCQKPFMWHSGNVHQICSNCTLPNNNMNLTTTWDLTRIYKDDSLLLKDIEYIKQQYPKYINFKGILNNPTTLLEYEKFSEDLGIITSKVGLYLFLKLSLNSSDDKYQEISGNLDLLYDSFGEYTSFIEPELQSIPDEDILDWISPNGILKDYRYEYQEFLKSKKHILTEEQNLLLSKVPSTNANDVFDYLFSSDMNWSKVKYNGKTIVVDDNEYGKMLHSKDRKYRKTLYKKFYKPIIQHKNVLASTLQSNVDSTTKYAKIYNYESSLHSALDTNDLQPEFYDNLIKTTKTNNHLLQRYGNLRKKYMGVDELHPYDMYYSIFQKETKEYTYEEGVSIVLESLKPMGEDYIGLIKMALENGRMDVHPRPNKSGGAFSSGSSYRSEPYVLLNWTGTIDDIFTLTHELGHNIHSYLTGHNQPYHYANYTIFLAEVASIFNETLLFKHLLNTFESKEDKLMLIEEQLLKYVSTVFRQVQFADFEKQVHKSIENGQSFSPKSFCELYKNIYKEYWGDVMTMDEEETYTWARIPHFYTPFYVYQYATGLAYAETVSSNIDNNVLTPNGYVDNFLKAGLHKSPIDILKDCSVDVLSPTSVQSVFNNMESLLDELENLIN